MKYYMAYGSNLNIWQMGHRCPSASPYAPTILKGYELVYKGSKTGSYLTFEPGDAEVPIGIWKVSDADERELDRYEGYPLFYDKKTMTVEANGEKIRAFVYIIREDRPYGYPRESYVEGCREGYIEWGFDEKYLDDAMTRTIMREGAGYGMSKVRKAI